jgi:hypothetical protein
VPGTGCDGLPERLFMAVSIGNYVILDGTLNFSNFRMIRLSADHSLIIEASEQAVDVAPEVREP